MLTSAESEKDSDIYRSPATYYNPVTCKWQHGIFTLQKGFFEFLQEELEKGISFHLSFPLQTISSIKKRHSSLIYSCIVIQIGAEMHWFASFPSRDSVYNLLELFWRNCLLQENPDKKAPKSPSPIREKIFAILHESEETLVNTANLLDEQNQQLDHIQQHVEDLNCELSHSERMLRLLPFYPSTSATTTKEVMKMTAIKRSKYKITFTKSKDSSDKEWEKGFLAVSSSLQILDNEENLLLAIPALDLVSINIVSPWELCINYIETNAIQSYKVMCPNLPELHKVLMSNPAYQKKVANKEDSEDACTLLSSSSAPSTSSSTRSASPAHTDMVILQLIDQVEKAKLAGGLSEEEHREITVALEKLQSLATEVTREKEIQMEKLKVLVTEAEKSGLRLKADTKHLRRCM